MAAFCPHGAVVAVCWHYLLREAPETFCKYMTENVMKHITPGRRAGQDFPVSDMWIPRFWSGSFSPARPGKSCSQQGAELMIKTIKETASRKNETRSEKEFLNSLERRYQIASTTETANHGLIGNSQELRLPSLKVQEYSPDILTGTGRSWKCMKDQRWYPSAQQVRSAQCSHTNALVRDRQLCTQLSIFEGRLAELLRFSCCQLKKKRKSRRIASFLMLSSAKIEAVSLNCDVFDVVKFKN